MTWQTIASAVKTTSVLLNSYNTRPTARVRFLRGLW